MGIYHMRLDRVVKLTVSYRTCCGDDQTDPDVSWPDVSWTDVKWTGRFVSGHIWSGQVRDGTFCGSTNEDLAAYAICA